MKTINVVGLIVFLLNISFLGYAQQTATVPPATPFSIVSRGPDSRVWESTSYELSPSGQIIHRIHSYVELATGLCYPGPDGQWLDSQEEINILPDGTASATNGQHQVYFPVDIYEGTITLITPDGLQLQSRPLGLCYDNGTNLVLIGSLTNSVGSLVTNNQAVYPNAFAGIDADLRYTYRKSGFEQEVVLRQQLPPPEAFGLDSAYANLEMLTEFFNAPEPTPSSSVGGQNGLSDATLSFGSMKMVRGKAFSIGDSSSTNSPGGVRVYKSWEQVGNRTFLVEAVPYENIASDLSQLPNPSSVITARGLPVNKANMARIFPPARSAQTGTHQGRIAAASWHYRSAVVLDYQEVLGDETNFTFQGDTTYLVTDPLYLFGTTTIEGGTVVKYPYNSDSVVALNGAVNCETASYRKAIFTASDDNSVGETISGSSGSPNTNGFYADYWALVYDNPPYSVTLDNLEINYAYSALEIESGMSNIVRDAQFLYDGIPLFAVDSTNFLENALMYNVQIYCFASFSEYGSALIGENLTIDTVESLSFNYVYPGLGHFAPFTVALTNSLLIAVQNSGSGYTGAYNYTNASGAGIFQSVGGGSHYLTNDLTVTNYIRGAGTVNIDPALLADLAQKTTWPPAFVYDDTNISSLGTLGPAVPRDTNALAVDLGYHYDVLDYAFGGCDLYSNLTFTAGTAVGCFGDNSGSSAYGYPYGISLDDGANLSFEGTATKPCMFVFHDMVQEGGNGNWTAGASWGFVSGIVLNGSRTVPQLTVNFGIWADDNAEEYFSDNWAYGAGVFNNCEFYNCSMNTYDMNSLYYTNCLFFRDNTEFWNWGDEINITYENCTFYTGFINFWRDSASSSLWVVENTAFDGTAFNTADGLNGETNNTVFNYNSYNTDNLSWTNWTVWNIPTNTLETVGSNDVMVTNYNWQTGWLGNFYLPTNSPLRTNGSTTANLLGLSDFTTQTNQVPDSTNIVDIGYHYFALNPLEASIEPTNETVFQGTNVILSATVEGIGPFGYQWYWDGYALSDEGGILGSGSGTLTLNGVNPDETGYYYVVITNDSGSVTSTPVMLIVKPAEPYDTPPVYVMPPYDYWNVTDISDPAQPVNIGELQEPFSEPNYGFVTQSIPFLNTLWHSVNDVTTEAYGTTTNGGVYGKGTVFQIGLTGGLTNVCTFDGTNGAHPCSQLAISGSAFYDMTNILYGTTSSGGTNGYGVVFKVNADGSNFVDLYEFTGGSDGKNPQTGLLIDGNVLYGTTTNSIFKINTDGTDFTCLTNVTNASQLILLPSGNRLYGTTYSGGTSNEGMLFSINTDGSCLTNLHNFTGGMNGEFPESGLELYGIGNYLANGATNFTLYGTTYKGGLYNYGMVFSITNDGSGFTNLHSFDSSDGAYPVGGLVIGNNNPASQPPYLYGTTSSGGLSNDGTLFSMSLDGTVFTTLTNFLGTNGAQPEGKLVSVLASRTLYGTTYSGGSNYGTAFSINYDGSGFTSLYTFTGGSDGGFPAAGLTLPVVDNDWSIWSLDTTLNVSAENATNSNYAIAIDNWCDLFVNGVLVTNAILNCGACDASWGPIRPISPYLHAGENDIRVTIAGDGDENDYFAMKMRSGLTNTLYGTTSSGGVGRGTVFAITAGSESVLYNFPYFMSGGTPIGDLVLSGSTLYGAAEQNAINGGGTIFSVSTDGSSSNTLYEFGSISGDGASPAAGLVLSSTMLYGTTYSGGTSNYGTVFGLNLEPSNYMILHNFTGVNDGLYPQAPLLLVGTNLYGTTSLGGANNNGTIFSICTNGSNYQTLYSFGNVSNDGTNPVAGLVFTNNTLYGTTENGGSIGMSAGGYGTIFSYNIGTSNYQVVYNFGATNPAGQIDGQNPEARLLLVGNILYGTTYNGGTNNGSGTIFSIAIGSGPVATNTIIANFGSADTDYGQHPQADLIILGDSMYGTTYQGGAYTYGMVFSISTNGTNFNDIYDFMGGSVGDGATPEGGVCSP